MKKLYFYLVAAVMMIGATACQQDAVEGVKNEKPSFTAMLNGTRTELGEGNKVMWNADDKIAVYTKENKTGVVFDGDATEAAATAKFTTTEEFAASTTGYLAVYPELKYDTSSYPPTSTIPAAEYADSVWSVPVHIGIEQDVTADGWDEKYNYMVAYSEDTNLSFQAATALIKFTYAGDAGLNATFYAEGAQLAGDAILNYNTADGSINYTTTGNSTNIDLFGLVPGETYYIPIYPGKVEYFQLSGYSGYMPATFYSYEGEFEFKAGKIYTVKAKEQSIPSPWTMMDPNMGTQASMSIDDNGYHVAKAVPAGNFVFYSWTDGVGEQFLSASKELGLYEWQATADDMAIAVSIPESNMFDVYLAPDASMFCVVEAGAMVPEMPKPFVPEVTTWAICGDLNSWGDTFMYTTETENLYVVKNVTMEAYSKFKVRKDSNWTTNYGGNFMYFEANKYMSVWKDGQDMLITTAGTYDIYFKYISSNEGKLYVVTAGEDYTTAVEQIAEGPQPNPTNVVFGLCGAHNNWGTNDTEMALDATLNAYVAKNAKLTGEFKVRGNKTWGAYNYGAASNGTVTVGKGIQVSNGSNTNLKVTSGTYDVYFSYNKNMVWVMKVGEVPADL